MDKITLFNQALHYIGDRDYYRNTPSGQECDLWFPDIYHEALVYGAWTFATKRTSITKSSSGVYPLPEDCLRLLKTSISSYSLIGRDVVQEGRPHDEKIDITYISNDIARSETFPETEPLFIKAITLMLASKIAMKLSSSPDLSMALDMQAKTAIRQALHHNVVQSQSNDQHPLRTILNNSLF